MELGSKARIKLLSFYLDKFMMSKLLSRACLPTIVRFEVPEGNTSRAECSTICEESALLASIVA